MAGSPLGMLLRHLTGAAEAAAFSAIVSASTAALVEGGLHAMSTVKLKVLLVFLIISDLTLGGAGLLAHHILGVKIPEEPPQAGGERAAAPPPENKPQPAVDRFGDPLPQRAIARLGTVRFRMDGLVCACAWSPDGKTLAAGSAGFSPQAIRLFDAATGKPCRCWRNACISNQTTNRFRACWPFSTAMISPSENEQPRSCASLAGRPSRLCTKHGKAKPSLEVRQRVTALLDDIRKQPLPPEMLRMLRGMEVLEHIGTPAARKIIASLVEGTPQARLTREAKAALQRLR